MNGEPEGKNTTLDVDEGEGTSLTLSLGEAIESAVATIPAGPGDMGHSVVVDEIWYTDGGIVGSALHVRVHTRPRG